MPKDANVESYGPESQCASLNHANKNVWQDSEHDPAKMEG